MLIEMIMNALNVNLMEKRKFDLEKKENGKDVM